MSDCLFCRIVAGEIPATVVRESARTLAFRDVAPQAPVHVLVISRDHHPSIASLLDADESLALELMHEAREVAVAEGIADAGYRLVFNIGDDGGQTVHHVHLHVLGGASLGHVLV